MKRITPNLWFYGNAEGAAEVQYQLVTDCYLEAHRAEADTVGLPVKIRTALGDSNVRDRGPFRFRDQALELEHP